MNIGLRPATLLLITVGGGGQNGFPFGGGKETIQNSHKDIPFIHIKIILIILI